MIAVVNSTTGWMVYVGGTLVAWRSKAQRTWGQSGTEAEFIAALAASNESLVEKHYDNYVARDLCR